MTRRSVLAAAGGVVLGSAAPATAQEDRISVVQGGRCFSVTPFEGDRTVEELYEVRFPDKFKGENGDTGPDEPPYYMSVGTTDLQVADTTITFLYSGPGGLSLVVVHGGAGGDGGAVTWAVPGLPSDGKWVVKDDYYVRPDSGEQAGSNYDNWGVDANPHTIDWTWRDNRTDGGAFRPLGETFDFTVVPAFNEAATLWERHYSGRITDWQVLSGSRNDPDRYSLSLDRPVTFTTNGCRRGFGWWKRSRGGEGQRRKRNGEGVIEW